MLVDAEAGNALIPGTEKAAVPGGPIGLLLGDLDAPRNYNPMDIMEMTVPRPPKSDEIVLIVGFAAGTRSNAVVRGTTANHAAAGRRPMQD